MVIVKTHYYFCVAVVEGDRMDFNEDFIGTWSREGGGGLVEFREAILVGEPLLVFGWRRHSGESEKGLRTW